MASDPKALAEEFDPRHLTQAFRDDPYPTYRALLEHAPVKRYEDGSYFLSRYADLVTVYRDTRRFSSDKKIEFKPKYGDSPLYTHHTTSLVFNDPPLHTRVRSIIVGALTPKAIAQMEPGLIRLVDDLADRIAEKGRADLIEDFAAAIPVEIIGNLLRVPHEDRGPLRGWSLAILGALEPVLTPEQQDLGNRSVSEFQDYLEGLIAERRRHTGDPSIDVLTRLLQGEGGEQLTPSELVQNCIFLLNAGHETTTNLIGNGLHILTQWPDERRRLIEDPALIRTAIEEFLRFESSNQLGNRITTEEVELAGEILPPRTPITLCIGAANRDPAQFPDPDRLDVSRSPNKHLAFAWGPHLCAGLSLARLEGRIAIGRFLERFPGYELAGEPVRGGRVRFRGFTSLPVDVSA
ncbi:cytochrome P450 [Microbaculum marinum]|uniref:Cytochrome P450 n=2 Tax=Microbaculum marinum TaxID=1764581 RepID=A0AAW9RRP1_9HYPH